ncbi:YceI family protein [Pelagibaculum spongiae]|uniref:YceI family protein n=2 Tax=Pelagibaculum spongiae TaxID=2080658 RepID=A0A2V1GRI0_9GAMM|nr:YceI family protein [Pelagibaculum spongiae]
MSFAHAAQWLVENTESRVSFITTKVENVAEVHRFNQVEGELNEQGTFSLNIPLESVDTAIEIRDQRMRDLLFEIVKFPKLKLSAKIAPGSIEQLAVGDSVSHTIEADVLLHGQKAMVKFDVLISKLTENKILVNSLQPVVINASVFNLYDGVEKLRKIAGLPSVSKAVPVSFVLSLHQQK